MSGRRVVSRGRKHQRACGSGYSEPSAEHRPPSSVYSAGRPAARSGAGSRSHLSPVDGRGPRLPACFRACRPGHPTPAASARSRRSAPETGGADPPPPRSSCPSAPLPGARCWSCGPGRKAPPSQADNSPPPPPPVSAELRTGTWRDVTPLADAHPRAHYARKRHDISTATGPRSPG